jgi:hypothetical protein
VFLHQSIKDRGRNYNHAVGQSEFDFVGKPSVQFGAFFMWSNTSDALIKTSAISINLPFALAFLFVCGIPGNAGRPKISTDDFRPTTFRTTRVKNALYLRLVGPVHHRGDGKSMR